MNLLGYRKSFPKLALVSLIEGLIALIALLVIPTDPKNAVVLGYSQERLVMLGTILVLVGIFIFLLLVQRKDYWGIIIDKLLRSKVVISLFFLTFFATLGIIGIYLGDSVILLRLSPVLVYINLVSIQSMIYQISTFREMEQFGEDFVRWLNKKNFILWVTLVGAIPLLFASAIKQEFPLGFAGLYTLMAEMIKGANFHIPLSVPLYGPGGIPFAYPPLGLYLMALFLKLGVSVWNYLRFAPPVFSLLALVPLFLLARRLSKSNLGGMVAALLAAGSFYLYFLQTESGGMVRGLAFGLGLLALYFFDRMVETFRWREVVISGVLFGLTVLTHLGYAYYFALCMGVWLLTHPKRKNLIGASLVGVVSTVVALPWILLMLDRYGVSIFSNALLSHGNFNFLSLFQNPVSLFQALLNNLQSIIEQRWFLVLVAAGLVCLVIQKKFTLPTLFLLVLIIFQRQDRLILTVSFFIVGYIISFIYCVITSKKYFTNRPVEKLVSSIILLGMLFPVYMQSFNKLSIVLPLINQEMLDMSSFMKNKTPLTATYLSIITGDAQDDEWFPYLTQREPVLADWGSEWSGAYVIEGLEEGELKKCVSLQSYPCLEDWFLSTSNHPDYIIMNAKLKQLSTSLQQSSDWKNVFSNWRYTVWEYSEKVIGALH